MMIASMLQLLLRSKRVLEEGPLDVHQNKELKIKTSLDLSLNSRIQGCQRHLFKNNDHRISTL